MANVNLKLALICAVVIAGSVAKDFKDRCEKTGGTYCKRNDACYTAPAKISSGGRPAAEKLCKELKFKDASAALPEIEEEENLKATVKECLKSDGKFFLKNDEKCETFEVKNLQYAGRLSFPLKNCNSTDMDDTQVICEVTENNIFEEAADTIKGIFT